MKRNLVLLAIVALLAVGLSIGWFALADRGGAPHDGGCASYCARAVVYMFVPNGKGTDVEVPVGDENFDEGDWVALDSDGDGKVETCIRELDPDGQMCIKWVGGCPEVDEDGDGVADRCVQPGDGLGFWCRLQHGQDTH